jgi:hypothetical protein
MLETIVRTSKQQLLRSGMFLVWGIFFFSAGVLNLFDCLHVSVRCLYYCMYGECLGVATIINWYYRLASVHGHVGF